MTSKTYNNHSSIYFYNKWKLLRKDYRIFSSINFFLIKSWSSSIWATLQSNFYKTKEHLNASLYSLVKHLWNDAQLSSKYLMTMKHWNARQGNYDENDNKKFEIKKRKKKEEEEETNILKLSYEMIMKRNVKHDL